MRPQTLQILFIQEKTNFTWDMPGLSVDIYLTYMPIHPRLTS